MKKAEYDARRERILQLCSGPDGATMVQVAADLGLPSNSTNSVLTYLVGTGRLHRAGMAPWLRYFTSKEASDAYGDKVKAEIPCRKERARLEKNRREREASAARRAAEGRTSKPGPKPNPKQAPKKVPQHAATARPAKVITSIKTTASYEVTIPETARFYKAPTPPGRFAFDPPPGWRGQITQDWLDRRLQGAK